MASITLGYHDCRGRVQPIRTLLEYVGQKYENKTYAFDTTKGTQDVRTLFGSWFKDKATAPFVVGGDGEQPMEFPNVPYYIETRPDGSKLKLTQTQAILKHIARQHGLVVEGEDNISKMEMLEQQVMDLAQAIIGHCFGASMIARQYPNYVEDIKAAFKPWEKHLEGKKWVMGDTLTYVDFLLFEYLDWHLLMSETMFEALPNLKAYLERFRNLPKVAEYFASDRFKSWPLAAPFAVNFGWKR